MGFCPDDLEIVPTTALAFVADQLQASPATRHVYGARSQTDYVNDQGSRHQRFDEPASLEKLGTRYIPAVKQVQHHEVSCIVENRTDWANKQDKPRNSPDYPGAGFRGLLWPDVIGRNRDLRKVVQEIVREHLQRRHRNKREEGARTKHTEHISTPSSRAPLGKTCLVRHRCRR